MKNRIKISSKVFFGFAAVLFFLVSCQENEVYDYPVPVNLITPLSDSTIVIDPEMETDFVFEWSELPESEGVVSYLVLFDQDGTKFESPVFSIESDNGGLQTKLSLSHTMLDSIAIKVGIPAKRSGIVRWAVDAIVEQDTITSIAGRIELRRPTSLGTVPTELYIYGTATEAGNNPEQAIRFHSISDGYFDLFATLKNGTYKIVNAQSAEAVSYFISDGELFLGDQEMEYASEESWNLLQIDFNSAEALTVEILAIEVIIPANENIIATLSHQGNNLFTASNVVFDFLVPGGPDSPEWLTWVEERYRFRLVTTGGNIFYGSYLDASMFGVYIPDMTPFAQRPDGEEPPQYNNVYAIPFTIGNYEDWAGCYKFPTVADGNPVNISLNLDPDQSVYVHSVVLVQ